MVPRLASRTKLAAVSALALTAAAGLGACGGSGSAATQTTSPPTSSAAPAGGTGASAFASCMESKGIPASALAGLGRRRAPGSTVPGGAPDAQGGFGPGPGVSLPAGVSSQQFRSAFQACRSQLPGGFGAVNSPAFAAYRNCLALHGYTLPARGPGATAPTTTPGETTTTVSAATRQAAMTACAALRPARPSTSTTTTPTGA